ncbi:MAG: hypothetical protein IJW39_00185, partial [Opitutales bacterium]|nr:hypothetical protein [Opitutales bacterium]
MKTTNTVSGISKFLFSTLVAAAAMTSTAFAWDPDNDDYSIGSLDEFKAFRDYVNGTDKNGNTLKGKTVTLTANIDLKSEEWTPIGNSTYKFQGTFDGGNYTISNLKISGNNSNVGLFGFTTDGAIKNFTLNNAQVSGRLNVGAVAGTPYTSKYSNITLTGTVQVSGMAYVGGVGGKDAYANWDNVRVNVSGDSYVKANSVENGTAYRTYVGGVIGFMGEGSRTISNVSSNIKVEGSTVDVGGIVGIAHYGNNFVNVSCTAESIKLTNGGEAADATEVGAIAGVWHNGQSPDGSVKDVTFENCTVGENTVVEATYTDASGEKVTNTYDAEAVVYGAAYLASGEGTLNVSATGAKQYTYNATIASGVSESYDQIIIGSKTDVPESGSVVTVKGTLSDSSSNGGYFWIGSNTSDEAAKAKFGLVVDGGKVNVSNVDGMNIRPDGYLSIKNGGELNAPLISTKYATIDVDGEGSTLRVRTNNLIVKDDSVLTLSNSATLEMVNNTSEGRTANIEISDGGKIEMDHTSTVVFGGTISVAEGSSLTLDTTGFTGGAYKVFDYTGT